MIQETGNMELVSTYTCMASDMGVHGNMFGGRLMALIDAAAGAYASKICDTPRMVTVKVDGFVFKKAIKNGDILDFYSKVKEFGRTSITMYIEVNRYISQTGEQELMVHTDIKFVHIDERGGPVPIYPHVKDRYTKRVAKYGKGLLTLAEREDEKNNG